MSDFKDRRINKKKKFVADGVFNAEVHELLAKILGDFGYGGVTIKASQNLTRISPKVASQEDKKVDQRTVKEIERLLQKRFGFDEDKLRVNMDPINNRGLSASAQVEGLKTNLITGYSVRYCAMRTINTVMRSGRADGCEVVISGKLRQQRAKAMKYKKGYIVSTGHPQKVFVDTAIRHVFLKQGVIGLKVKIMLPYNGGNTQDRRKKIQGGIAFPLPDKVTIETPKEDFEEDVIPGVGGTTEETTPAEPTPEAN